MRVKIAIATIGIILLLFGIVTLSEIQPRTLEIQTIIGFLSPAANSFQELHTSSATNFDYPEVVSENDSFELRAQFFFVAVNPDGTSELRISIDEKKSDPSYAVPPPQINNCVLVYTASALSPGLNIYPGEPIKRVQDTIPTMNWVWVAQAKQPGSQQLLFTIDIEAECKDKLEPIYIDTVEYIGDIEVKNWFGLSLNQSKVLGYATALLGPIMTLPGLLEFVSSFESTKSNEKQKTSRKRH